MGSRDHPDVSALRRRAGQMLWIEHLARALAPAIGILIVYLAIALFGFASPAVLSAALFIGLAALGLGLARLRRPRARDLDRRIERVSGLRHRPLDALEDRPETDDPAALTMWQAHQRQLAVALRQARTGAPDFGAPTRDPFALRMLLLLLLLAGIIVAGPAAPSRLAAGFALPAWPFAFARPSVNAWITPPDYAGAPPHLLEPGEAVTALPGSKLALIVNGPRHAPAIRLSGTPLSTAGLSKTSHRADAVIEHSGRLTVGSWWHRLGAWNITVAGPAAPVISLRGLRLNAGGQLALKWHVADPYGLTSFSADFHLPGYPEALPLKFALPAAEDGAATLNLSASPFYGLGIGLTLNARNLAGVSGNLALGGTFLLPGLNLHDKTALVLDKLRQDLAIEPQLMPAIAKVLRDAAAGPPSTITDAADVQAAALASAMAMGATTPADAVGQLLVLIRQIEAGPAYATAQALARSGQALLDALRRGLQGQPPNAAELQLALQAMRQALAQHLAQLAPRNGASQPEQQSFDPSALDRLAQQIAKDEAAGRMAQAAAELRQLQAALNALASAQPMTAAQAAQAQAAQQAAQALGQLTNGEAALLDDTHRGNATGDEQSMLQKALEQLRQSLKQAGIALPGLSQAGAAMGRAQSALGRQDEARAEVSEAEAIQNLQKAAASLNAARQNTLSIGQGEGMLPGQEQPGNDANGAPDEDFIPGVDTPAVNPATEIQRRIMEQDARPNLPASTRSYLQRLLDPGDSY